MIKIAIKASEQVSITDITDAYSVTLTSEAYTFMGNTSGAPSGLSCKTQVVAYCGSNPCSKVTVGTISCPTGISATISNNNTVSPTITFKTTATVTTSCEATIPVSVDGVTINKKFSFSVAKKGNTGATGAAGKGVDSITNYYLATTANSGVTTSTSGWTTTVQSITSSKRYLWNYEKVTYTDNTTMNTTPAIIGVWGNTGSTGAPGADGVDGRGISSITEYYLASASASGITTSTSGWTTTMQSTTTSKKYLWNYEKITYTDGTTSNSTVRIIGTHGATGATGASGTPGIDFSQGKMLFTDPMFASGVNSTKKYANSGSSYLTWIRSAKSSDNPMTGTSYEMVCTSTGAVSPGNGGFSWAHASRANAIFIYRIIAKIPTGRSLVWASNSTGSGSSSKWLTSSAGTGKFTEYLFRMECGSSGTFSSTGYFYVNGTAGTSESPLTWYVAYATCFDMTNVSDVTTAQDTAEDAAKVATNYMNFDDDGLIIGDLTAGTLGKNILIDKDTIRFRNKDTILATYADKYIHLGQDSLTSTIYLCGGNATIRGYLDADHDNLPVVSIGDAQAIEINSNESTTVGTRGELYRAGMWTNNDSNLGYVNIYARSVANPNWSSAITLDCGDYPETSAFSNLSLKVSNPGYGEAQLTLSTVNSLMTFSCSTAGFTGDITSSGSVYASNWFRSYGQTGWYNQTYGAGIWVSGTDRYVRSYNAAGIHTDGVLSASSGASIAGTCTFHGNIVVGGTAAINSGCHIMPNTTANPGVHIGPSVAGNYLFLYNGNGTGNLWLQTYYNGWCWYSITNLLVNGSSDIRLKNNVADTKVEALPVINRFKLHQFDRSDTQRHYDIGFIADELELEDALLVDGGGYIEPGKPSYKTVNTLHLLGYVVKGIQELYDIVQTSKREVEVMRSQLNYVTDENARLKKLIEQ